MRSGPWATLRTRITPKISAEAEGDHGVERAGEEAGDDHLAQHAGVMRTSRGPAGTCRRPPEARRAPRGHGPGYR